MRKILFIITVLLSFFLFKIHAQSVDIVFFYSDTCPHCHKEEIFLDKLQNKYPQLNIQRYEVTKNKDNQKLFKDATERLNQQATSVPFTIMGNEVIIGYQDDSTTGKKIESVIKSNIGVEEKETTPNTHTLNIPFINKTVELEKISLPALTVLIGILDGFNPCAMWVLLFLISMLLGTKNRKKLWILGTTFIVTSALIYFLFLSTWLSIFLFIGYTSILKIVIGLVALYVGIRYLDEYRKAVTGCEVSEDGGRQKIFKKIKGIIEKNNMALALVGIILLAITVNFVELLCSAGLPAVYTQILATSGVSNTSHYLYLLLYVLFFMIDDIIVFIIAMVTLETVGISSKYTRMSHLIGGIIMVIIGILMLFRPDILMFR